MRLIICVLLVCIAADSLYSRYTNTEQVKAAAATGCLLKAEPSAPKSSKLVIVMDESCVKSRSAR